MNSTIRGRMAGVWLVLLALLCVAAALALLGVRYCGFTNFKDGTSGDYARYTNMIWNCAHGRPFLYFMDQSYLKVHLSFSLALLGILYWIVDHPFLLAFLQWFLLVSGAGLLAMTARKLKLPWHFLLGLLLFWLSYHFSQSVVLCEFHGVCTYFVLIPFLYFCLLRKKILVWLPFALILGLREEAGLMILPILLYFAVRDRWRAGYVYAGIALLYVLLACFVLYPLINGMPLLTRRAREIALSTDIPPDGTPSGLLRLRSLFFIVLPTVPFLWKTWRPMLLIPSVAVLVTLASAYHSQIVLRIHYPAVIMACLAVAMIEAARRIYSSEKPFPVWFRTAVPLYLVAVSTWSYCAYGMLWGCREELVTWVYRQISGNGVHALWVARHHVPPEGALFTDRRLGGFVANRAFLSHSPHILADARQTNLLVFAKETGVPEICARGLESGEWGVRYADDGYVVLQRGAESDLTGAYLAALRAPRVRFASTFRHAAAQDIFVGGAGIFRYWKGSPSKWPAAVAYGKSVALPPGCHNARFVFKVQASKKRGNTPQDTGMFLLFVKDTDTKLAEAPVELDIDGALREQVIPFKIAAPTEVEPRVYGGGASLWLLRVTFEPSAP